MKRAVALALVFAALTAGAQTLVSIDRADADKGMQHIECWLVPQPAAARYVTGTLVIDCGSDPERIFGNGFDGDAGDAGEEGT